MAKVVLAGLALQFYITSPNDFSYFKRSLQPTTAKETKPTMTPTKQINIVHNGIKFTNYFHVFAILFYYVPL